jgi:fibro-slime domain-containing protein
MSGTGSTGTMTGSGGQGTIGVKPTENPCAKPGAPDNCKLVPSGPACGDKAINQASEECDDGNSLPGDGCSGVCKTEPFFVCPTPGMPCTSTIVCGDGMLGPGEACDDGNTEDGDGCSARCTKVDIGYVCRTPGKACTHVYLCGDGVTDPNEGCDDKNNMAGDGCDPKCRIELGFKCAGAPSACTKTTCGDKKVEGAESCDDGNAVPLDGCSAQCQAEPTCPASGACSSSCGDGILFAGEDCDDGNLRNGDGCSSTCKIEEGFKCANDAPCAMVNGRCSIAVPAIFRDFNSSGKAGGHPDFQPNRNSGFKVITGLVETNWDADKKPVFSGKGVCVSEDGKSSNACTAAQAFIQGQSSFKQWYRDDPINSGAIPGTIQLWDNGKGGYVNRLLPSGAPLTVYVKGVFNGVTYPNPAWCSNTDCTDINCASPPAGMVCLDDCIPDNNTNACYAAPPLQLDGNPLFFPVDPPNPKILNDARHGGQLTAQYGFASWPWEKAVGASLGLTPSGVKCDPADEANSGGWCHNFGFTTEVKYWFKYDSTTTARLDFTGDDDVWVFVNGKLAVDLGGWHVPLDGSVTINAASAATFGLENGKVYQIGVFQAEREHYGSSFRLTLSGFNLRPSDCVTNCGDGVVAAGEECDDGPNNTGAYNQCSPSCTLGPRCGDRIKQEPQEACDDGVNDGAYGGCAPNCQPGPHCGDGVVQPEKEQCDDGKNDGSYGTCAPGCVFAAHCGDGHLNSPPEDCDDGNNTDNDGCTAACKFEVPK